MPYNPEHRAKEYVKSLPEEDRADTDMVFKLYEAYLAGHKDASTPESQAMVFDNTYEEIIKIVCKYYKTSFRQINTKSRKREKVHARQVCMFFADKFTNLTQDKIAAKFGRDHSTFINSLKVINNLLDTDKKVITDIRVMEIKIKRLFLT